MKKIPVSLFPNLKTREKTAKKRYSYTLSQE